MGFYFVLQFKVSEPTWKERLKESGEHTQSGQIDIRHGDQFFGRCVDLMPSDINEMEDMLFFNIPGEWDTYDPEVDKLLDAYEKQKPKEGRTDRFAT